MTELQQELRDAITPIFQRHLVEDQVSHILQLILEHLPMPAGRSAFIDDLCTLFNADLVSA